MENLMWRKRDTVTYPQKRVAAAVNIQICLLQLVSESLKWPFFFGHNGRGAWRDPGSFV